MKGVHPTLLNAITVWDDQFTAMNGRLETGTRALFVDRVLIKRWDNDQWGGVHVSGRAPGYLYRALNRGNRESGSAMTNDSLPQRKGIRLSMINGK